MPIGLAPIGPVTDNSPITEVIDGYYVRSTDREKL